MNRMDYPIVTPEQLAAQLRSLRRAKKLSQAELGARVGLNQPRIAKIESGPRAISVGQLMRILGLLGARLVLQAPTTKGSSGSITPPGENSTW